MDYYGAKAYRSDQRKPLSGQPKSVTGAVLRSKGQARNIAPFKIATRFTPRDMRKDEKKSPTPQWLRETERYGALNERCIRPISISKIGNIIGLGWQIGRIFTYIAVPAVLLTMIVSVLTLGVSILKESLTFALVFISVPFALWMLCWLIHTILPFKHGIGSPWEINRQTGMVSVFTYFKDNPKAEPLVRSVPFAEMDGYIYTAPDRFGFSFLLVLVHRYSDVEVRVGELIGADSLIETQEQLWDFIQNYMDTSKPLPDIPLFEEFRPKDPTTAVYDQQIGRNPRYWIDMSDEEWSKQEQRFLKA